MPTQPPTEKALLAENENLRDRLEVAEETLNAIRRGDVDALVVQSPAGTQVHSLQSAEAESNRFRGEILNQISEIVIATDIGQNITYFNAAAERQYRVRADDVLGRNIDEIYTKHWPNAEAEAARLAVLRDQGEWHGEMIQRTHDAREVHVEVSVTVLRSHNHAVFGLLTVIRDITERKRVEEALRESSQDFIRAQEVGQLGCWRMDTVSNILTFSDECYRIFGIPKGTPLTYQSFLATLHPEDRDYVHERWSAALKDEPYDVEYRTISGGTVKWVRAKSYLEYNKDGSLHGGFGIAQDITERKQAEIALKEADRQKNEFLAMLGHELRNPLTPISNIAHSLNLMPLNGTAIAEAAEMLVRNVNHITHLVDDLLDVSRITRGVVTIDRQPIELGQLLKDTSESVRSSFTTKQQTFKLHLLPQPVFVDGDPVRLTQVFSNLLINASKYTGEGGHIYLKVVMEGPLVIIRVKDNGIGIDPQLLPHIFGLFTQGERTLARSEGGLGIGLTLVKKLVDLHGGEMMASSRGTNQGSEFMVKLPIILEASTEVKPDHLMESAETERGLRILMIDDNEDVVDSIALWLEMEGHQVETASNGVKGISVAKSFVPDIILLDIGLPEMDGYQVAQKLREQSYLQKAKIVAMSGYDQGQANLRPDVADFDHYLLKPPKIKELQNLLAEVQRLKHNSEFAQPN